MVRELADYERAADQVRLTAERLEVVLLGPEPTVFAAVALDAPDQQPVGFALWFRSFSTWTGCHGVYLEDLYVRPEQRGRGYGRALLAAPANDAVAGSPEGSTPRLEWSVLDWNAPALGFYSSLGAVGMDEWTVHRLTGDALHRLARG